MSIVHTLKKIVDPQAAHEEEQELRKQREQPKRAAQGEPPVAVCKVCGHRGTDRTYCPECLADTMVLEAPAPGTGQASPGKSKTEREEDER